MSERVVWILAQDFAMNANRVRVIFNAQGIVCADIADLSFGYIRGCLATNR